MIDGLIAYLGVLAVAYLASISVYFAIGCAIAEANRRYPERRIQKNRAGEVRASVEIRNSMVALLVSSFWISFGFFAQARGWTIAPLELMSPYTIVVLCLSMAVFDAWSYLGHRLLHTKLLYSWHQKHHRSVAPTAWSNDSSTILDTFMMHSFYGLVVFVLPIPAVALILHRLYDQVSGMIGHAGFEHCASPSARWPSPMVCVTFHDQHHSQFHWNYGNFTSIWDRLFGTLHPDYDTIVSRLERKAQPEGAAARTGDR